jgi:hypothetical protein
MKERRFGLIGNSSDASGLAVWVWVVKVPEGTVRQPALPLLNG